MRAHLVPVELLGSARTRGLRVNRCDISSSGLRSWRVSMLVRATERRSACTDLVVPRTARIELVCALLLRCGRTERKAVLAASTKGEGLLKGKS
jgi:hypothetical protein